MNAHVIQALVHRKQVALLQCANQKIKVGVYNFLVTDCDRQIKRELWYAADRGRGVGFRATALVLHRT